MNKVPLGLTLGTLICLGAFGLVAYQYIRIRERLLYPYLAKQTVVVPVEARKTITNQDGTNGILLVYKNPSATTKSAAILFPDELIDIESLHPQLSRLELTHRLVVVPIYRGATEENLSWPSERLLEADADSAFAYVTQQGFQTTYIGGERLGAALASHLATKNRVAELELTDPWLKTSEIYAKIPLLGIFKLYGWDEYATDENIRQTQAASVTILVPKERSAIADTLQKGLPITTLSQIIVE